MTQFEELTFLQWLKEAGYNNPRPLQDGRYTAIVSFAFTHAIIVGQLGDTLGYNDRWCYDSHESAKAALEAWDGTGEPAGWHRHPISGRRRNGEEEWVDL